MKALLIGLFLGIASFSHAGEGDMGVGVMLGNPTGLSGKYWLEGSHAIDGGVGFSFGSSSNLSLHSDYLIHSEGALVFNDETPLDVYFGLGGRMKFDDDIRIGARVPVGVAYRHEGSSDMFAEVAPALDFISRVGVDLHLLLGARYYFQ